MVGANEELARQKLNPTSDIGSTQLDESASSDMNTFGKKKVHMNLLEKKARVEESELMQR